MRLGILGPAAGDLPALARRAQVLIDEAHAERVLYLGDDDALDRVVEQWARGLVGADASEEALFVRAATRCTDASPAVIDAFVASERARQRLSIFASVPPPPKRTVEILDGRVVVLVHDKSTLDEEDIAAATILVFGESSEPVLKRVGARLFVSPGVVLGEQGGMAILDDTGGGVRVELLGPTGIATVTEIVGASRASKIKVQGGGST